MSKIAKKGLPGKKDFSAKKSDVRVGISAKTMFTTEIKAQCASAAPPLGPLLGRFGLNISNFCKDFNEKTKNYKLGIPLPVTVRIKQNRNYDINLLTPSIKFYLMQAAGIEKEKLDDEEKSGEITLKHIYEIAKIKYEDPYSKDQVKEFEDLVQEVADATKDIGLEIVKEIDPVKYKEFLDKRQEHLDEVAAEAAEKAKLKLQRM